MSLVPLTVSSKGSPRTEQVILDLTKRMTSAFINENSIKPNHDPDQKVRQNGAYYLPAMSGYTGALRPSGILRGCLHGANNTPRKL